MRKSRKQDRIVLFPAPHTPESVHTVFHTVSFHTRRASEIRPFLWHRKTVLPMSPVFPQSVPKPDAAFCPRSSGALPLPSESAPAERLFFRPEEALHLLFSPPVSAAALPWPLPFRPCPWYVPAPVFYSLLTSHLLFSLF